MRSSIHSVSWALLAVLTVSASRPALAAPDVVTALAAPSKPPAPQPIEMREVVWGGRYGDLRHKLVPFQANLMLDDRALFRLLGREDLLRADEETTTAKHVVTTGALLALIGSGVAFAEARPKFDCSGTGACRSERSTGALAAGVILLIVGASLIVADVTMSASPISDDERVRLVDQFNRSIKPQPDPQRR